MEAKISRTCPGRTSSMSKLLWESKQKDEDRPKKILSKIVRVCLGFNYTLFQIKKKNFIHAARFCSTKVVTMSYG